MASGSGRVPLLTIDGKLPDEYTPQAALTAAATAVAKAAEALAAAGQAGTAQGAAAAAAGTATTKAAEAIAAAAQASTAAATAVAPVATKVTSLETLTQSGRLSEPALSATIVGLAGARNTVVLFGTSLEHQNRESTDTLDPPLGSVPPVNGRGWFHWTNAFLGDQLRLIRNSGIEGNTYAQMLARIETDVMAYDSDWVFLGPPVNDLSQGSGRTAAAIIADATAIIDRIRSDGRRILTLTPAPSTSYDTLAKRQAATVVAEWMRALPFTRPEVIVVDAWKLLVNPATGAPATGMTNDGIVHYSQAGAARIGKAAADAIRQHISNVPARTSYANDPASAIANPNFLTNGAGWGPTAGVTASFVPEDTGFGNKAVLTFSGITTAGDFGMTFTELATAGRFVSGDVIQLTGRFKWSNLVPLGIVSRIQPVLRCRQMDNDNAFIADSQASALFDSDNNRVIPAGFPTSGEAVLRTFKTTVRTPAAGIKSLALLVGFVGIASGVVEVSDLTVRKVT